MTRREARQRIEEFQTVDLIVGARGGAPVVLADHSVALSAGLLYACDGLSKMPEVPLPVRLAARDLHAAIMAEVAKGRGGAST